MICIVYKEKENDMKVHDFTESLEDSHEDSKDPIWKDILESFFPGCELSKSYDDDIALQKSGIDDVIRHDGKSVWIDRKFRKVRDDGKIFDDIALECLSDEVNNKPGWIAKDTKADYWIYLNRMDKTCHLIPTQPALAAWKKYKDEWIQNYSFQIRAYNKHKKTGRRWTTLSYGIPVNVVDKACQEFGEDLQSLSDLDI